MTDLSQVFARQKLLLGQIQSYWPARWFYQIFWWKLRPENEGLALLLDLILSKLSPRKGHLNWPKGD